MGPDSVRLGVCQSFDPIFAMERAERARTGAAGDRKGGYLIVGVTVDELVAYKGKHPVIPFEERIEIVRAIRYVDEAVAQTTMDKMQAWEKYHFQRMFVGDDWKNTEKWNNYERQFQKVGVEIIYFPYTKTTSSTLINQTLLSLREDIEERRNKK